MEKVPDDTTLIRWAKPIGSPTLERLNERAVALARSRQVTRGRKLRVDTTVIETNIHHPSEGALLGDGVWDSLSWLGLGIPAAVALRGLLQRSRSL